MYSILRIFLFSFFLLLSNQLRAKDSLTNIFENIHLGNYQEALDLIKKIQDTSLKEPLLTHVSILRHGPRSEYIRYAPENINNTGSIIEKINNGLLYFMIEGKEVKAFEELKAALVQSKNAKNRILVCESLKYILEIYERFHLSLKDNTYKYFLEEYYAYAYNNQEKYIAAYYDYRITQRYFFQKPDVVSEKYIETRNLLENLSSPLYKNKRDNTHYVYHNRFSKNVDSASYFIDRALRFTSPDGFFEKERFFATKINYGANYIYVGQTKKGLEVLNSIRINDTTYLFESLRKFLNYRKHIGYESLGDSLNSYKSFNAFLLKEIGDNQSKNLQVISEYETKYQTAEKEKQNLLLTAGKKRNQNIATGLGGSLLLGSIIVFLAYRNTKRKQRIAEQERELDIQRTERVLKEKEIETINAMVEGQEKERLRLAGDLHDSIGGTLAAIKMHIGNMQNNLHTTQNPEELLNKANLLISEAYKNVRAISHERNSGVMAKDGLLPAVQRLARNVSSPNLTVEVQDFGLEKRLNPDLEITIFRIVQELVTNIIKHAQATETTISLTQHKNELNIMVEDNGIGFKTGKLPEKEGMGLGSIERRVEHLEGTMEVDSTIGKGTNIIIDIPL